MNATAVIDVRSLPNFVQTSRAPLWWGMVLLLVIESTVFGTLIVSYFYLSMGAPTWPPPGIDPPELLLPTLNTLILVGSSVPMHMADKAITRGDERKLFWGLLVAMLMGISFLVLKVVEYADVPYRWHTHAYGSVIWTIIGFHSAHVLSVVLKTIVMCVLARRGLFDARRNIGVTVNGIYWHFVAAVWIPLYLVIYWAPRMM